MWFLLLAGYHTYNGYQCGGKRIDKWNDGDDSDSGKTIKDLPTCKKICSQHSECKAFELSKETTNCNYWIKGPLFPTQDITETHDCYVQKRGKSTFQIWFLQHYAGWYNRILIQVSWNWSL